MGKVHQYTFRAILPEGFVVHFSSNVEYFFGTSYKDIYGGWHLGSRHRTLESAVASAKRQNRSPVWADKPVQVVEIIRLF